MTMRAFGGVRVNEYDGFERVAAVAAFVREHGPLGAAVLVYFCGDLDEERAALTDQYPGF